MPRPLSLSFELLQTFLALVRHQGDTSRVAAELGINQPSLSKRLAYLQHAGPVLRRPWVERVGKTWNLTPEGQRMRPAVEELVHRYRLLLDAVAATDRADITFACGQNAVTGLVRDALHAFRRQQPAVTFRISTLRGQARIEGVANGSLDLALVSHAPADILTIAHRPLYIETLLDDALALAAVPSCPGFDEFATLTEKKSAVKVLAKLPLILPAPDSGLRRDFDHRLPAAGVTERLHVVLEVGGWSAILACVLDGLGVGLLPRSVLAKTRDANLAVRPLPSVLAPEHVLRVIARMRPLSDQLDLSAAALQWLQALRTTAVQYGS